MSKSRGPLSGLRVLDLAMTLGTVANTPKALISIIRQKIATKRALL